jgi:hypothetical protein
VPAESLDVELLRLALQQLRSTELEPLLAKKFTNI